MIYLWRKLSQRDYPAVPLSHFSDSLRRESSTSASAVSRETADKSQGRLNCFRLSSLVSNSPLRWCQHKSRDHWRLGFRPWCSHHQRQTIVSPACGRHLKLQYFCCIVIKWSTMGALLSLPLMAVPSVGTVRDPIHPFSTSRKLELC